MTLNALLGEYRGYMTIEELRAIGFHVCRDQAWRNSALDEFCRRRLGIGACGKMTFDVFGRQIAIEKSHQVQGSQPGSIVGEPSGRYLWMLTREAQPSAALRTQLEARVKELGYDWSLVRLTQQPGG